MKEIDFNLNGINVKLMQTRKYKTIKGIISFVRPIDKEDFTYYSLLSRIIGGSTNSYPTKKSLSNKMFELYDFSCYLYSAYAYKMANCRLIFSLVNPKYANDENLFKDSLALLKDIIFNPKGQLDSFDEHNFYEEKKFLENEIKNVYNNKSRYAYKRFLENMAPNDILSTSQIGDLEVLNSITPKSLFAFYKKIINESFVTMGISGDLTEEDIINNFKELNLKSTNYDFEMSPQVINYKKEAKVVSEAQDIIQAKLIIGFRCDIDFKSKDYAHALVFDNMFGGMFGSTLFQIIREKHSLTYDISSNFDFSKKIFLVSCGLDPKNITKTKDITLSELDKYREGKIDESLLQLAKDSLVNELLQLTDSQSGYLSFNLESIINKRESIEEIITKIKSTTINDIIAVSKKIKLDTIYSLVPGEAHE